MEQDSLRYWVYGGIGAAGVVGRFIRENGDVDIYVVSTDFANARQRLAAVCELHEGWTVDDVAPLRGRPKMNLLVRGRELLSMVPVYETVEALEFRAYVLELLPRDQALVHERRQIGG